MSGSRVLKMLGPGDAGWRPVDAPHRAELRAGQRPSLPSLRVRRPALPIQYIPTAMLAALVAFGQAPSGSIAGAVLDAESLKPIPAALVMAVGSGAPLSRNTRSGADGVFHLSGLAAGTYSICIQAAGGAYLDPCQWNGRPATVTVAPGREVSVAPVKLAPASVVQIEVRDAQNLMNGKTKDGRVPNLSAGVWGPAGLYYPARLAGGPAVSGAAGMIYGFQVAAPRDTALTLAVSSGDLQLGDAAGTALSGNASRQGFVLTTGDTGPRTFSFTLLGALP